MHLPAQRSGAEVNSQLRKLRPLPTDQLGRADRLGDVHLISGRKDALAIFRS